MRFVEQVKFVIAYSFMFSPRPGTPAFKLKDIDKKIKKARLNALQSLLKQQQAEFNKSFIDKEMDILLSSFVSQIIDNLDDKDLNKLLKFLENDDDTLYKMNQKVLKIDESGNNKIHKMFIGFKPR